MEMDELFAFAEKEHARLVAKYGLENNPKTRYTIFAKLVEEVGELSEAILAADSLQRADKLGGDNGTKAHLEGEIADVLLTTLILAKELDIDARKALEQKIATMLERQ